MEFPLSIAYNMKDKKVGCVLMQCLLGANINPSRISLDFETEDWDLSPINLKVYTIKDEEEYKKLISITENKEII